MGNEGGAGLRGDNLPADPWEFLALNRGSSVADSFTTVTHPHIHTDPHELLYTNIERAAFTFMEQLSKNSSVWL